MMLSGDVYDVTEGAGWYGPVSSDRYMFSSSIIPATTSHTGWKLSPFRGTRRGQSIRNGLLQGALDTRSSGSFRG